MIAWIIDLKKQIGASIYISPNFKSWPRKFYSSLYRSQFKWLFLVTLWKLSLGIANINEFVVWEMFAKLWRQIIWSCKQHMHTQTHTILYFILVEWDSCYSEFHPGVYRASKQVEY